MAQTDLSPQEPASAADPHSTKSLWRRLLGRTNGASGPTEALKGHEPEQDDKDDDARPGLIRRVSRKVVPGLPRAQTFKRQQSEIRNNLEPVQPTPAERRAMSVDRRLHASQSNSQCQSNPRTSAPDFVMTSYSAAPSVVPSMPASPIDERMLESIGELAGPETSVKEADVEQPPPDVPEEAESQFDAASMTSSMYDQLIHDELERIWILNLSMHFRDKSKREKFFVTYRERDTLWRRVTISLDYRNAPENSLERDLIHTKFQRDKNAKIYEAIRESLVDIQFYDTVTNLKLQTTDGRLHVHVVEDVNEIIHYPTVRMIQHLRCRRVKERDIEFDSHMSGFVYKVRVNDEMLIKKEIPGPDTVDEFLYEVNALNRLRHSRNVIQFYGVIVDDDDEHVKGLLISYAEQGSLIDIIYDNSHSLPWHTRERWARQIIEGLSEIHESGFVQGDFTLSNIVIDNDDNAKIIDINRRGCPVGWEPPEATPLIESSQRISMYIGVKSDLYQLGMVLWALATQEDEPEAHGRPLQLDADVEVPQWYRGIVETCLADDPRLRAQALQLLRMFPDPDLEAEEWARRDDGQDDGQDAPSISVNDGYSAQEYFVDGHQTAGRPLVKTVHPPADWAYLNSANTYVDPANGLASDPYYYPTRGRSPPSPLPSDCGSPRPWTFGRGNGHDRRSLSASDAEAEEPSLEGTRMVTPRSSKATSKDLCPPAEEGDRPASQVEGWIAKVAKEAPAPVAAAVAEEEATPPLAREEGEPTPPLVAAAVAEEEATPPLAREEGGPTNEDPTTPGPHALAEELHDAPGVGEVAEVLQSAEGETEKNPEVEQERDTAKDGPGEDENSRAAEAAGNTEPAPGEIHNTKDGALSNIVPEASAAEETKDIHQIESASMAMDNAEAGVPGEEKKAEEGRYGTKLTIRPPSSSSQARESPIDADLKGIGSGHDQAVEEAAMLLGTIDDDLGTATTTTVTTEG